MFTRALYTRHLSISIYLQEDQSIATKVVRPILPCGCFRGPKITMYLHEFAPIFHPPQKILAIAPVLFYAFLYLRATTKMGARKFFAKHPSVGRGSR